MENLCSIKGSKLYFNGEELLKIESIEKIEVKTLPVRQAIKSQLLNSIKKIKKKYGFHFMKEV